MRPGGRIQAVIDLLQRIETPGDGKDDTPADVVVSGYVRGRRYIGGGDRRFIGNTVFAILRNRARLDWRAGRALEPREQAVVAARLLLGWDRDALEAAFDGGTYSPAALSPEELALFDRLEPDAVEPEPLAVAGNLPAWLADRLGAVFGDTAEAELTALAGPAPVDLRVNALKADRETALAALAGEGVDATPTPWSPLGLRLAERTPLANLRVFREGLVEVQDEGSQIAAALVDARPGMAVLDLCAGAGGKTLALAAAMANEGRIAAVDIDPGRLRTLEKRAERAGVTIVETAAPPSWDDPVEPVFDRVLADVPCSGAGAWRRHPEAPWRLTPERLAEYGEQQEALLEQAAARVRPGGRLVYVTCSLLPDENEARIESFLASRGGDFRILPVASIWTGVLQGTCPATGDCLVVSPHRTGTDGFFVAILERQS